MEIILVSSTSNTFVLPTLVFSVFVVYNYTYYLLQFLAQPHYIIQVRSPRLFSALLPVLRLPMRERDTRRHRSGNADRQVYPLSRGM